MKSKSDFDYLRFNEIAQQQAKAQGKQAKPSKVEVYSYKRKGYCKALPKASLTSKASQTVLGTLIKGTESSFMRNVDQTDARPKNSLADRRIIRDTANVPENWLHYPEFVHGSVKLHDQAGIDAIFQELIRLKLLARSQEFELARAIRISGKEYQNLRRALKAGKYDVITKIIQRTITANQVRG